MIDASAIRKTLPLSTLGVTREPRHGRPQNGLALEAGSMEIGASLGRIVRSWRKVRWQRRTRRGPLRSLASRLDRQPGTNHASQDMRSNIFPGSYGSDHKLTDNFMEGPARNIHWDCLDPPSICTTSLRLEDSVTL
jgi:hypothetical protein